MKRSYNDTIRKQTQMVSLPLAYEIIDPTYLYNGAAEVYEDPADYYPRGITVKAVRLA
jgi:hypothetical protein